MSLFDPSDDAPADEADAPLFARFWANSELNDARAWQLAERIGFDAAVPYRAPRPLYAQAAQPLPVPQTGMLPCYEARRSQRAFGDAPLSPAQLSALLMPLAQRQAAWSMNVERASSGGLEADLPAPNVLTNGYEPATRYLQSGGAKYPVLTYGVLLKHCDAQGQALPPATVWYDPVTHGLTPLGAAPAWRDLARWLGVTDWATAPAAVWLLVAQADYSCRKYGERGGRFVLLEAGGFLTALSLQVAEAGLAGTALGSFHDQAMLRVFGLAPDTHQAVVAYACGASLSDG